MECGTDATVGYPIWSDTEAMLAIPWGNKTQTKKVNIVNSDFILLNLFITLKQELSPILKISLYVDVNFF